MIEASSCIGAKVIIN